LGETLGNISDVCRKLGVSRRHYYDIKSAIEEEGLEGLLEKSRKAPRLANRVAPEVEKRFWIIPWSFRLKARNESPTS